MPEHSSRCPTRHRAESEKPRRRLGGYGSCTRTAYCEITRNGTDDDPALLIEQEDGTRVLKLRSEVSRA